MVGFRQGRFELVRAVRLGVLDNQLELNFHLSKLTGTIRIQKRKSRIGKAFRHKQLSPLAEWKMSVKGYLIVSRA